MKDKTLSKQELHYNWLDLLDPSTSHRTAKTIRQLVDILAPLQNCNDAQFILVEGLPGVGKTFSLNEMS